MASSYNTHNYKTKQMEHKAVCNVELEGRCPLPPKRLIILKAQLLEETQEITAAIRTLTKQREYFYHEDCGIRRKESGWE